MNDVPLTRRQFVKTDAGGAMLSGTASRATADFDGGASVSVGVGGTVHAADAATGGSARTCTEVSG